jgi:hypothetical protein
VNNKNVYLTLVYVYIAASTKTKRPNSASFGGDHVCCYCCKLSVTSCDMESCKTIKYPAETLGREYTSREFCIQLYKPE